MKIRTLLYLRTDLMTQKVVAGGSVAHTIGVIRALCKKGIAVHAAASCMASHIADAGALPVKSLNLSRFVLKLPWRLACLYANVSYYVQTRLLFKDKNIDCIYQRYSFLNCVGVLLSFFKRVPLVLEYNGSEQWIDKQWGPKRVIRFSWLVGCIEWLNLSYAHAIIVVSQVLCDQLCKRGIPRHKILVNPNGVDTTVYDPALLKKEREHIRTTYGMHDAFVFSFVGTFSAWHGISILRDIIPKVLAREPRAHFLLVGDGPLKASLQHTLSSMHIDTNRVTFTGMIPQQRTRDYLAASDAFLCPTQPNPDGTPFFGSPTKMFEYMSMAKPTIASDIEQVGMLLSPAYRVSGTSILEMPIRYHSPSDCSVDSCVAILAPHHDSHAFEQACYIMMNFDKRLANQIGVNARVKACTLHTWDHHVHRILAFLEQRL